MASPKGKSGDKSTDVSTSNELKHENSSIKDKHIENSKEIETNGSIEDKSPDNEADVHVDASETETVVDSKSTELSDKPIDFNKDGDGTTEKQQAIVGNKESSQQNSAEQAPKESVVSDESATKISSVGVKEEGNSNVEKKPPMEIDVTESDQKNDKEKTSVAQGGLPKWMVEDANAPPSPSPEVDGHKEQQQSSTAPQKGRGRGRGRRPAVEKTSLKDKTVQSPEEEPNASQRPRRSTRTKIDYANPDAVTVLAEVDDEQLSGTAKRQKVARGPKLEQEKGPKRKAAVTSEEEVREEDDDDLDYGAKKKKKRVGALSPGKRGRPAGSKSKGPIKGKPLGRPKRGRNNEKDSEEDDAEVVYDDRVSEKEQSSDDEFEETKPSSNKLKTPVQNKPPAKKRGRPPGRRPTQKSSTDGAKIGKTDETDETKESNEESSANQQQTVNVEA